MRNVDQFFIKKEKWTKELILLHEIILQHGFDCALKWGAPTYIINGQNVIGLAAFKNHFGLWFFQGALLKDKNKILVSAQEKTKALRQLRFNSFDDIDLKILKSYIVEAKCNALAGNEVPKAKLKNIDTPEILDKALSSDDTLAIAFNALTSYKRKEYKLYIIEAKRETTKVSRLAKIIPMIKSGVGLHDKYKNC